MYVRVTVSACIYRDGKAYRCVYVCVCVCVRLYVCVYVCQQKVIFCLLKASGELWFVTSGGYRVVDVFCNPIEFLFLHSKPNPWCASPL